MPFWGRLWREVVLGEPVPREWLRRRHSAEAVTARFGREERSRLSDRWQALRAGMRPGDEVWSFSTPPGHAKAKMGMAGYALVRDGRPYAAIVTWMT